jgi:hypothetical protein
MTTTKKKRRTNPGLAALNKLRAATAALVRDLEYRASGPPWSAHAWCQSDARIERLRRVIKSSLAKLDGVAMERRFQARCGDQAADLFTLLDRLHADHDSVQAACATFPRNLATRPRNVGVALQGFDFTADLLRHELREPVR